MRDEYDFSNARRNPFENKLKKQVTIDLDVDTYAFFKSQVEASGIPCQTLIGLYLADCAAEKKVLTVTWQ